MNKTSRYLKLYEECMTIRFFENKLLNLFSENIINGTTHTCLGQEINAIGVCSALKKDDIVVSNHRSHGHFIAHCKDTKSLMKEILGKDNSISAGVGGSQQLNYKKKFYSHGVLGGSIALAAGLALSLKKDNSKNIVACFIGDGAFGEGIVYETLNISSLLKLPLLIIVENNKIAQSTRINDNLSGTIAKRFNSFEIENCSINNYDIDELIKASSEFRSRIVKDKTVRTIIIDSVRLGPHSKGDDNRDKKEINNLLSKDPINALLNKSKISLEKKKNIDFKISKKIEKITCEAINAKISTKKHYLQEQKKYELHDSTDKKITYLKDFNKIRFSKIINNAFEKLLIKKKNIFFIGEDILDPYGGTFKITKNLQEKFPNNFFSSPVSEASITGLAGGLSLGNYVPIVEIMFGDFIGLIFDQIINYISKYDLMFPFSKGNSVIIRTPMGGRRGYGPTHSQSLEKYFLGIPNFFVIALNKYSDIYALYEDIIKDKIKVLILENKKDYNLTLTFNKKKINGFNLRSYGHGYNEILELALDDINTPNLNIICYGGMLDLIENVCKNLFIEHELNIKIILITNISNVKKQIYEKIISKDILTIIVEEGTETFNFSSEIKSVMNNYEIYNISTKLGIIPNSLELEKKYLLDIENITNFIKDKLNI